jgi:hypothetical protein
MERIFVFMDSMKKMRTGAEVECTVATPYKYLGSQTPAT